MKRISMLLLSSMTLLMPAPAMYGQGSTAALSGTVMDPTSALVPGADVSVKNNATSAEYRAITNETGSFTVPALSAGTYTVTVSLAGFKQAVLPDVKIDAGVPASVRISLEVGNVSDSITVLGAASTLQTETASVLTTIVGREILELPSITRDALFLTTMLPGATTTSNVRNSRFNNLPRSAISILIDGINTQENLNKDSDFYSYVSPRLDAIEEVTVSTAAPGADSSGEGSIQIKMVTRQGSNQLHGSIFEYLRNSALNANYWFNNRDLPPDPETGKAPRDQSNLNQYGFRLGGPIVRDRVFFFVNLEQYRLPFDRGRQRTILNPLTQQGVFMYNTTVNGQTQVQSVDLLALAASNGHISTVDPVIARLLTDIRNSTTSGGSIQQLSDPNLQRYTFANACNDANNFATLRMDFNISKNHHLEHTYNAQTWDRTPDCQNTSDPTFPGFPGAGLTRSTRYSEAIGLRSTLTANLVNQLRLGVAGGKVNFYGNVSPSSFSSQLFNQMGFHLAISGAGITNATVTTNPTTRNSPTWTYSDTLTWIKGAHSFSFGGTLTHVRGRTTSKVLVPTINFGVDTNDPANVMFSTANFQGAANADLTRARNIYAVLTGRITSINGTSFLDENTNEYVYLGQQNEVARQREFGFFFQDSWKKRPNLTLNYGLRWELQLPVVALNNAYSTTTYEELWGVSGVGNLFKPGVMTGKEPRFVPLKPGEWIHKPDYGNIAPSVGFAWTINRDMGWLNPILGGSGKSVLRGAYAISYNKRGLNAFTGNQDANPGGFITTNRNNNLGNLATGVGSDTLPVLLRQPNRLGPPAFNPNPVFPLTPVYTNGATIFDDHLKTPYVQSWTMGLQRELGQQTVVEVRYVGNFRLQDQTTYNLNEVNIVENKFIDEFQLAQANLQANIAAGRGSTFKYFGPGTGTTPLPILFGYIVGKGNPNDPNAYPTTSTQFSNTTFINRLAVQNPSPYNLAQDMYGDAGRRGNALDAGLPANFFMVNPNLQGGAEYVGNGGWSRYHSAVIELRRRMSKGLLVQSNYTFGRGFATSRLSFRKARVAVLSGDTIPHAFKTDWIYELPVGTGRTFLASANGNVQRLLGGWELHGNVRVQQGDPISLGNLRLIGLTRKDLQKAYGVRFDDANKIVYGLPQDIIDNTIRANNVSATSGTGFSAQGAPTGRYIAPANGPGCIEIVNGDCGGTNLTIYGNTFTRFDLSLVKKTRIRENVDFEFRTEFLNAFNFINFNNINTTLGSAQFGQITSAWRDTSNTNDPGGRLIQFVGRINF